MKYFFLICMIVLFSCNSSTNENTVTDSLPNPEVVNPPQDAIPEDMTIKNDSVVVPDSAAVQQELSNDTSRH